MHIVHKLVCSLCAVFVEQWTGQSSKCTAERGPSGKQWGDNTSKEQTLNPCDLSSPSSLHHHHRDRQSRRVYFCDFFLGVSQWVVEMLMGVVCTIVPSPFKLTWVALLPICIAEASHRYRRLYFANVLEPPSIPPSITLTYKWPPSPTSLPTTPPSAPNNPLFSVTGETIYDPRQRWMCGGIKREIATPTSDVSLGSLHWAFQVEISTYMPTN